MNKKQLLLLSAISTLIVSSFGVASVFAASPTGISNQLQEFQNRFGITLTDEQKAQVQTKQTEMETKRSEALVKWESMNLATYKQQQIDEINAMTQEEFDKIKARQVNMLKNGKGFGEGLRKGIEKPAE